METSIQTDYVVVGAGIAGLRAAIGLSSVGRVLVITKEQLSESNTSYAQGGIAVAMSGDEDVSLHLEDTVNAGDGLVDRAAASVLVAEGPLRVHELLQWGTGFDRHNGELMFTREAAHSRNRIMHANGDATGAEIGRSLLAYARALKNVTLLEWTMCIDLLIEGNEVTGLTFLDRDGRIHSVHARAVLLASGGAGQVYSDTTNPSVATGDGIAMAYRAGAQISDMEFYQFHPTALSLPGVPRFLLSEALRGEGAYLLNAQQQRFMERYHPLLELAPRDVVARAVTREGIAPDGSPLPVYLDMRHVQGLDLRKRFPGITAFLAQHGLDLSRDLIPIRPAAHYLMGGVKTDIDGRASMKRLYSAGEAACTGVHGANRLASNSLLEGLVFGARAAEAMKEEAPLPSSSTAQPTVFSEKSTSSNVQQSLLQSLKQTMWQKAGLLRDASGLREAESALQQSYSTLPSAIDRPSIELRNLHSIGELIVRAAFAREESRGAHYRNDFPQRDDAKFQKHSVITKDANTVQFVRE